jgi:hypothetical protein
MGGDGIAYVNRYLEANAAFGKQLGRLLLDRLALEQGSAWAFVPDPLPDDRKVDLADFETGGLLRRHGQQWRQKVMAWISGKVGTEPHVLFVEDGLARPSDPFVASLDGWRLFCQESVIECVELPTEEDISDRFSGATWNPDIAILIPSPSILPATRTSVSSDALADLVDTASTIGVGAWDDEGAIFWESRGAQ